jgi:hypothetical protein
MNDMKMHEVFGMMEGFLDGGLPRKVTILDGGVSPKGNFLPQYSFREPFLAL